MATLFSMKSFLRCNYSTNTLNGLLQKFGHEFNFR